MNEKGDVPCAKLLDEQVTEEVVVPREVRHVHDLGKPPRGSGGGIVSAPVFGHLECPRGRHGLAWWAGWWWYGVELRVDRMGLIALRTRTHQTDDAIPVTGHASSHDSPSHMGQG